MWDWQYSPHSSWMMKYFIEYYRSCRTLLWIWIMLWNVSGLKPSDIETLTWSWGWDGLALLGIQHGPSGNGLCSSRALGMQPNDVHPYFVLDGWSRSSRVAPCRMLAGGEGGGKVGIPPCTVAGSGAHASRVGSLGGPGWRRHAVRVKTFLKLCKDTGADPVASTNTGER